MPRIIALLLADADILIRHPLAEYLRDCGYRVLEAASATEARTLIASLEGGIDLALVDAELPPEGGFALARWVRDRDPRVRVLLAGSLERAIDIAGDLCEQGAALMRPYENGLVHDRIKQALAARARAEE